MGGHAPYSLEMYAYPYTSVLRVQTLQEIYGCVLARPFTHCIVRPCIGDYKYIANQFIEIISQI